MEWYGEEIHLRGEEQSTSMPRRPVTLPPSVFPLAQERSRPLRWRLHQGLKAAILAGQLAPGTRLPSTRALADSLGVSRSTVVEAFDQLAAEGFLDRRAGSGSYVSHQLRALPPASRTARRPAGHSRPWPSRRGQPAARATGWRADGTAPAPFTPCEPDVTLFPHPLWARMLARHARTAGQGSMYPDPAGLPQLRQALAAHLTLSRGVTTDPGRIIVVSGARAALHLCAHTLLDPGDSVWCEDPGYPDARLAFSLAGANAVPVPVDADGIDVDAAERLAPHARAAYVTPSHQFPTGAIMDLGRRLQLLSWAARHDAWIIEDDYDSEFCYDNRPLPALQGIDERQSVAYIGTLNKITYPGLRLGYLVTPAVATDAFAATAATMSLTPPTVVQAAFADFIAEGHLTQHITRMRAAYRERRQLLVSELGLHLGDHISVPPTATGMHTLAALRHACAETTAQRGNASGLDLRTLASYAVAHPQKDALVLGYTHLQPHTIRTAVQDLARILR
jgi:GntR family transcriptional regulator/MocR family aminotransferase